jgi:hypothetical protein
MDGQVMPYSTKFEICQRIALLVGVHRVPARRGAHTLNRQRKGPSAQMNGLVIRGLAHSTHSICHHHNV